MLGSDKTQLTMDIIHQNKCPKCHNSTPSGPTVPDQDKYKWGLERFSGFFYLLSNGATPLTYILKISVQIKSTFRSGLFC